MTGRQLTFTDLDENPLIVRLERDRIVLAVIDSRPELAAAELRAFASALYAEYVAPHLVSRLATARDRLALARDADPAEHAAAVDGAMRALDDVVRGLTAAGTLDDAALPPAPRVPPPPSSYPPIGGRRGLRRARDPGSLLDGGWSRSVTS